MKAKSKRKVEACKRSLRHILDHPILPPNVLLATLATNLTANVSSFRDYTAGQSGGQAEFRSGTMTRRQAAEVLRDDMRAINKIAKALPKEEFPGVRELFLMPRSGSYEALIARANAFLEKIGPIKAVFVERSLPADFDEKLAEKLAAVDTASDTRDSGRSERVGGTAGSDAKASEGIKILREIDSILSHVYRDDPALLASWQSACHVDRDPSRAEEDEEPASGAPPPPDPLAMGFTAKGAGPGGKGETAPAAVEPRVNGSSGSAIA